MSYILVTNDDGIDAPSLHVLARAMGDLGHIVTIAAPTRDRSGCSAGIGNLWTGSPFRFSRVASDRFDMYAIDLPPAAIVSLAANGAFGRRPDLVVAGVNPGWNVGHGVIHSGTFGAALTAAVNGIAGVAVSLDHRPTKQGHVHWETAALVAGGVVDVLIERGLSAGAFNVNVPNVPARLLRGLKQCQPAPVGSMWRLDVRMENGAFVVAPNAIDRRPPHGTDLAALLLDWASITFFHGLVPATFASRTVVERVEDLIAGAVRSGASSADLESISVGA